MTNFWPSLKKPFFVLAPMEDVTDFVFREVVAKYLPRPAVFFTEFTSSDGLTSIGYDRVVRKLKYSEEQRPIVAQIWGNKPEKIFKASQIVKELGFDGIDLNLGCPERNLVKKKCGGSGLIGEYSLVQEIIESMKEGASGIPISVKTRLGIKEIITDQWITFLLEQKIDALTIHGRIAKQMSNGEADWGEIGKGVKIRDRVSPKTIIIGNGDVSSLEDGTRKSDEFGVDGIMIARGVFHNPWVFGEQKGDNVTVLLEHAKLFDETWGKTKNFEILKKFFKMYLRDSHGVNTLRMKLMECKNYSEMKSILGTTPLSAV